MRTGDTIGGYTLLEDFRVVGAGLSEWTFAARDGREFFLKRFLSPTYPDDAAPGSATTKARKRARCAAFEAHHRGIQAALAPITRYGGNLVATLDFFREGAKYYKVTEKIDPAGLDTASVARLDFPVKLVLLKTVAHSLRILHDLDIVHSDLKPSNVLIKATEFGYTTKLIDFDNSYIVGSPPPPDEIVGTMNYYSPELVRYIQGDADGTALTEASDVFALGLIYAEYLIGAPPAFDPTYRGAAIAVLNGATLTLPPAAAPEPIARLVAQMLLADPTARPTVERVHSTLMEWRSGVPTTAAPLRPPPATGPPGAASALRGKGLRLTGIGRRASTGGTSPATPITASPVPVRDADVPAPATDSRAAGRLGGLVGTLLSKLEERRSR
ncbi:protein kinase domain-containing protein [Nakamurella sp. GG22]